MPFTPSHAVVALPFLRTPLVPGAIAVGAMAPDLPLFFDFGLRYDVTHGFPGLLLVGVPLAFVLFVTWRVLVRPVAAKLVPRWIGERLPAEWNRGAVAGLKSVWNDGTVPKPAAAVGLLLGSLTIGVASHVVWDLFTHEGRWGSDLIPAIAEPWGPLYGHSWLQHASSIFGLAVLGWWAVRWLGAREPLSIERPAPAWLRIALWVTTPACLLGAGVVELARGRNPLGTSAFTFTAGTNAGAAILLVVALAALVAHVLGRRSPER